jgi:hypothetical protein
LNVDQVEQGDSEVCTSHILECPSTLDVFWIFVESSELLNVMFKRNVNTKLRIVFKSKPDSSAKIQIRISQMS